MRVVIQRVLSAYVIIKGSVERSIDKGLLIFLGIEDLDTFDDCTWLIRKIVNLRIFDDDSGVMNKSVTDINGEIMVISQFTLHASTKKGNRPSYIKASKSENAIPLYNKFVILLEDEFKKPVKTGEFGTNMKVGLINDGPVTIFIDSKNKE